MKNMKNKLIVVIFVLMFFLTQIAFGMKIEQNQEPTDEKIKNNNETDLPSYFSWRDIDGVDFTTPVRAQQPYSSC
jgi:hypothetical protein